MTTYAVGDIQGCLPSLEQALRTVDFSPSRDVLWAAGDLINRGPDSLGTLRFIKNLGAAAQVVLGNHDLHFLAVLIGKKQPKRKDTLTELLDAPDCGELATWLKSQPLVHYSESHNTIMVHAGIPAIWTTQQALNYSNEIAVALNHDPEGFFSNMYGNSPNVWDEKLEGFERLRVITNYFTRMRFCGPNGELELETKTGPESAPDGYKPWFSYARNSGRTRIIFGHWASLLGATHDEQFVGLDTGCVWGGHLTLYNLDTQEKILFPCNHGA